MSHDRFLSKVRASGLRKACTGPTGRRSTCAGDPGHTGCFVLGAKEASMRAFFDGTRPGRSVTFGATSFELPVLYFRDDSFAAVFTADYERVRQAMPSDRLYPVTAPRGRALIVVAAFDYLETSVGPYGEVAITVPAVHGRKPPPLVPMAFDSAWSGFGHVVLHLPVTRRESRDGGRGQWGYTKFVADMEFENTPELHACRLSEGADHILTLRVTKRGLPYPDRRPLVTYSVKDGDLLRTTIPQTAIVRTALGAGGSSLELGEAHPVARAIRDLGIELRPLMTRYFLDRMTILPEGVVAEQGVRPLEGHRGVERDEGELHAYHAVH